MLSSERPKPSQSKRRRIFEGAELEQTIAAAKEPCRTLFTLAALTGARVSELLGLTWGSAARRSGGCRDRVRLAGGPTGERRPTKTDGSARTVPIPRELALIARRHKLASPFAQPTDYVFTHADRRALAPAERWTCAAHRAARAVDEHGSPTFPVLHRPTSPGACAVPQGALPSMHSFRHTVASRALLAGESVDEVAFLLGHRDANITRAVYVRELADARRRAMRRSRMVAEFGELFRQ